jgi:cytochrome b
MNAMYRLRLSHAALAILVVAAYLTGEVHGVHAWIGYGVAVVIAIRIGLAFTGAPQLGLMRFYPAFDGLRLGNLATHPMISHALLLGIAISLLGVMATGIMMDRGRTLGLADASPVATAYADDDGDDDGTEAQTISAGAEDEDEWLEELHETLANILIILVGLHVTYLLIFKRPIARFMLFAAKPKQQAHTDAHL